MVKRIPVGAHYGLRDWLLQRATAVVILAYVLILLGFALANPQLDFVTWKALFANLFFKGATFIAALAILLHAWVGARDIVMDYVPCAVLRVLTYVGMVVLLLACLAWVIQILWGVR